MQVLRQVLCTLGDSGRFFSVKFEKKDGSERTMCCKFTKMGQTGQGMAYNSADYNLIPVMDVNVYKKNRKVFDDQTAAAKSYRMINVNTILEINGVKLDD